MLGSRVRTGARQVRVEVVCWRTTLTHKNISGMADQCPPYHWVPNGRTEFGSRPNMTPDEREKLIRRTNDELWNTGNVDFCDDVFAARCSIHNPTPSTGSMAQGSGA
jgi:hypothetical protein